MSKTIDVQIVYNGSAVSPQDIKEALNHRWEMIGVAVVLSVTELPEPRLSPEQQAVIDAVKDLIVKTGGVPNGIHLTEAYYAVWRAYRALVLTYPIFPPGLRKANGTDAFDPPKPEDKQKKWQVDGEYIKYYPKTGGFTSEEILSQFKEVTTCPTCGKEIK